MNPKNHFELSFFPKETGVIKRFEEKLKNTEAMEEEVEKILKQHRIKPEKIHIKAKKGRKRKKYKEIFEGFDFKRYKGKIRGKQEGLTKDKKWKTDFSIYLLFGEDRDGLLYTLEKGAEKEVKEIGKSIHSRLMESVSKQGAIPCNFITRVTPVE